MTCDHKDGSVESLDKFWPVEKSQYKGWNIYDWRGSGFRAYKVIADRLWPTYPPELNCVDHINPGDGRVFEPQANIHLS